MSHTTTINAIIFKDIEALSAAVKEMNTKGIRCTLEKGGTPRAYYANQQGMGPADYVLRLPDAKYDVGFYMNAEKGGYEARTDLFGGSVNRAIGTKDVTVPADKREQAQMGQLYQLYGVHAATRQAARQGYTVQRVAGNDGSIKLVVGGIR